MCIIFEPKWLAACMHLILEVRSVHIHVKRVNLRHMFVTFGYEPVVGGSLSVRGLA
jgi:hypothetical protein